MAGGVDSTAQKRRVQRQRSLSRRNEAGSSEVSTSETIPVEQPTTTKPLRTLTASDAEKAADYYTSFDPDQLVGPKLYMEWGIGNHSNNDEEHINNVSAKESSENIFQ
ncbi:hypothetical protein ACOSQ3_032577 [Xanthoceras sorbifolium]